jgi:hypothetical protein
LKRHALKLEDSFEAPRHGGKCPFAEKNEKNRQYDLTKGKTVVI